MSYINMGSKKLAVVVAVVVAIIAAAKRSTAQTPPAMPDDTCLYDLYACEDFTDPSSKCCKALDRAYHKYHSCLCTYLITDDWMRNIYLGYYASCKINVPQNICMSGENPINSAPPPPPPTPTPTPPTPPTPPTRRTNTAYKTYCIGFPGLFGLFSFVWFLLA